MDEHDAEAGEGVAENRRAKVADKSAAGEQRVVEESALLSAHRASGLSAEIVSPCQRKLVARHGDVQIVFKRQVNRILEGKFQLAALDEPLQTLGVVQARLGNPRARVGSKEVRETRIGLKLQGGRAGRRAAAGLGRTSRLGRLRRGL